jgi:hypothetical protein
MQRRNNGHPFLRDTDQALLAERAGRMVINDVRSPFAKKSIDQPSNTALVSAPLTGAEPPTFGILRHKVREVDAVYLHLPVILAADGVRLGLLVIPAKDPNVVAARCKRVADLAGCYGGAAAVSGWIVFENVPDAQSTVRLTLHA